MLGTGSPLPESEVAILRQDGEFTMENAIPSILEAAVLGMYALIVVWAIYLLYNRGIKKSRARQALRFVTVLMFIISTILLILDLYSFIIQVKQINIKVKVGKMLEDIVFASDVLVLRAFFPSAFFTYSNLLIGDLILLWRTWALWQDRLLFMIGPMVLWVASFATFLTFIIMYGTSSNFPFIALIQNGGWDAPLGRLQLATWLLSMLTNLVATMTITYKAWQHRSMIKMSFNESTKRSQIGNILALMIEPGCFYFVLMGLQIMQIVGQFDYGPVDVFHEILNRISEQFYGLYPTVIIVLVELQRTIWDSSEYSSSNQSRTREAGVISSIRFTATAVLAQYSFGMETMGSLPDV